MEIKWEEIRPFLYTTTNISNKIIVYKNLDRDIDIIKMSIENLNYYVRLNSETFEGAKKEAIDNYLKLLEKYIKEING